MKSEESTSQGKEQSRIGQGIEEVGGVGRLANRITSLCVSVGVCGYVFIHTYLHNMYICAMLMVATVFT